jgi:hypothetical protein
MKTTTRPTATVGISAVLLAAAAMGGAAVWAGTASAGVQETRATWAQSAMDSADIRNNPIVPADPAGYTWSDAVPTPGVETAGYTWNSAVPDPIATPAGYIWGSAVPTPGAVGSSGDGIDQDDLTATSAHHETVQAATAIEYSLIAAGISTAGTLV